MSQILGIGLPLCDRSIAVSDEFLCEHSLPKATTIPTYKQEEVDHTWKKATDLMQVAKDQWSLGGSCTNVIKALAKLGNATALFGKVGSDQAGRDIALRLQQMGVHVLLSHGNGNTGTVNCFITPDHERTMHGYFGASSEFTHEDINPGAFDAKHHVHLDGYSVYYQGVLLKSIEYAMQKQATVSLDLSDKNLVENPGLKAILMEAIKNVGIIFGNVLEMCALTGKENGEEAASSSIFESRQVVVITNGDGGCWVKAQNSKVEYFTHEAVEGVVDTTGAGDYFIAGFLDGTYKSLPVVERVRRGHLLASFVIQQVGTDLPEEKWDQLHMKLKAHRSVDASSK